MPPRLTGLFAAAFTPFDAEGELRPDRIPAYAGHLLRDGVSGVYVAGTTGEGPSLTSAERRELAEAWVAASDGRLPVVVQVGHDSLHEARALARHAQDVGAAAISATPPAYFKPADVEALADCLARIADAAPDLPLYYYHIPGRTGVTFRLPSILAAAGRRVPTLAGAKCSSPELHEVQASLARDDGRFDILHGIDESLLGGLTAGVRGAVGSTYNLAAPLYRRLIAAFDAGHLAEARRLQGLSVAMVEVFERHGGLAAIKAAMRLLDLDCGPPRLPLRPLPPPQAERLRAELAALGFFQWAR